MKKKRTTMLPMGSKLILLVLTGLLSYSKMNGQATNPAISSLPYSLTTYTGNSFPSSLSIGLASSNSLVTNDFTTNAPNGTSTGQWNDEGNNGISYQGSTSNESGCFKVRMNTTGLSNINVIWTGRLITNSTRSVYMELQWRNGNSGSWNNVSNDQYSSSNSSTNFNIVLPSTANNLADLQIRWIVYDQGSIGTRDRIAVDDIYICVLPTVSASNNGPICAGSTLNLTATGSSGTFAWSGPSSFSSTSQNPSRTNATAAMAGTYTVTVTNGGCSNSATTVATVNAPTASASSNSPVCSGSSINLSTTTISGATYAWSGPNGFTSSINSPVINGSGLINSGTYTVITTLGGCTATSSTTVVVNSTPTITAGSNGTICSGSTLNLTATGNAGTYSWSGPNGFTSSSQNPSRTNATTSMSGTYTVTVTSSGCSATSSTSSVVNESPSVSPSIDNSNVCAGTQVQLNANAVNQTTTAFTNSTTTSIPDNNATGIESSISVSGISPSTIGALTLESVKFNITHTYDRDLRISLKSPAGTVIDLVKHRGGSGNNFTNTVIVSSGGANGNVSAGASPFTGTYNSETAFTIVNGENINGTWKLAVRDTESGDTGSLLNWTLSLRSGNGITYTWSSTPAGFTGNTATINANPNVNTQYTVVATGSNSCSATSSVSVTTLAAPNVSVSSNTPVCSGTGLNFSANNIAPGQSTGNMYSWTGPNGFTSSQQNPAIGFPTIAMTGTYSVTVTNQFLCSTVATTGVDVHSLPSLSIGTLSDVTCFGFNNGTVHLNATGGTAPYDFTDFNEYNNTGDFSDLAPGAYAYYVSDAYGCSDNVSFNITEPSQLVATSSANSPLCIGSNLNLLSNISGGTMPYSINWAGQNGFSSQNANTSITNIALSQAGNYTLNVTDAKGCVIAQQAHLVAVDLPATINAGSDQSLCSPVAFSLNGAYGGSATSATWTTSGDGTFNNIHAINAVYTPGSNDLLNVSTQLTFTTDNPNACGAAMQQINVKAHSGLPLIPNGVLSNPSSVCPPVSGLTLAVIPSADVDNYLWQQGPTTTGVTFQTPAAGTSVNIGVALNGNSTYNIRVIPENACGTGTYRTIQLRRSVSTPLAAIGSTVACPNETKTYSIVQVAGAETYTWSAPAGSLINGNPTPFTTPLTTVDVTFPSVFTNGNIGIQANVGCFTSPVKNLPVSTSTVSLTLVSGPSTVCPGSDYTFTVPSVSGAVTYQWILPNGVTGTSTSNSIQVSVTNAFTSGSLGVRAYSTCGNPSAIRTKSIVRGTPSTPASIAGPTNGLCSQTALYNCPTQAGATYSWTLPSGANINSGNGTSTIEASFDTFLNGPICVTATNSCGSSAARCVTVKGAPNSPAALTVFPTSWCSNESGIEFNANVSNITGSYSLQWIYPGSNVAEYVIGGGNSSSLILDWNNGGGNVIVTAFNACGSGSKSIPAANDNCRKSGENKVVSEAMVVYPNPATNNVSVMFYNSKDESVTLNVLDLSGRLLQAREVSSIAGANEVGLELGKLARGTYVISIKTSKGNSIKKVTLE